MRTYKSKLPQEKRTAIGKRGGKASKRQHPNVKPPEPAFTPTIAPVWGNR
jgi:hypothetical protein